VPPKRTSSRRSLSGASGGRTQVFDGYVRVSQRRGRSGDSFQSPRQQQERIEDWARAKGYAIGEIWVEIDESGKRADRPKLMRALERIEAGESDGLVVARLDRFSRSLLTALTHIERIKQAGGGFVSVRDDFDSRTSTGSLVLGVMLSLAEFELERVTQNFADARRDAVARGLHPAGRAPVGYRREKGKPLEIDDQAGPIVAEIFNQRAAGVPMTEVARYARTRGLLSAYGNEHWTTRGVREVIRNRVYLGESRHGEFVNPSAHAALVDPVTWERAQRRGRLSSARGKGALLSGLARCAGCRYGMRSDNIKGRRHYACHKTYPRGRCQSPAYITAPSSGLHEHVRDVFFEAIGEVAAESQRADGGRLAELQQEAERAREAAEQLTSDSRFLTQLGPDEFLAARERFTEQALTAEAALLRERDRLGAWTPQRVVTLREEWDNFELIEQRQLLASVIDAVFIFPGRGPASERVHICFRGEAPADMPTRGRRPTSPPTPFVRPS
jgi:DNA invertase Pin-like site-specific DNA recombinase